MIGKLVDDVMPNLLHDDSSLLFLLFGLLAPLIVVEAVEERTIEISGQAMPALEIDVRIIEVGLALVDESEHTVFATHSLEEIEEGHATFRGHDVLLSRQKLY